MGFIINLFVCGGVKNVNSVIECHCNDYYWMFNYGVFDSFQKIKEEYYGDDYRVCCSVIYRYAI